MAQQNINIGTSANKGDGDPLRTAFDKINDNFDELYLKVVNLETGGVTVTKGDIQGSVFSDDSTVLVDGVNGTINASALSGTFPAIDGSNITNLTIPAQTFASLTGKPTTLAGYGITDATSNNNPTFTGAVDFTGATSIDFNTVTINNLDYSDISNTPTLFSGAYNDLTGKPTLFSGAYADLTGAPTNISTFTNDSGYLTSVPAQSFASITGKPTTLAGYGITDATSNNNPAFTGAVDFTGATSIDFNTVTINNLEFADISTTPTTLAGYGITDGFDGDYGSLSNTPTLFSGVFADLTSKPTTIAGYGITDAFDGAFGSLSGTPTTLSGYGITDALASTSTGNVTLDVNGAGLGISIGNASTSGSTVSIGAEVNNTSVNMNGVTEFNARAIFSRGTHEIFYTFNGQGGVTDHNVMLGHLFYHTGVTGDLTPNFTNFDLTAEDATNITIIIQQGNTAYEIPAIQIGGAAQTIVWQNNSAPTGTANGTDSFSFTILNDGGTYVVLGQMVSFGGV